MKDSLIAPDGKWSDSAGVSVTAVGVDTSVGIGEGCDATAGTGLAFPLVASRPRATRTDCGSLPTGMVALTRSPARSTMATEPFPDSGTYARVPSRLSATLVGPRSEERRVGKECRSRW